MEELEPQSQHIARELRHEFPGVDAYFSQEKGVLKVTWPSQNPAVTEDFVLDCKDIPSLYWFKGYMFDFFGYSTEEEQATEIRRFIRDFFAERIGCALWLEGEKVHGGGPAWFESDGPDSFWKQPGYTIRSWRGTRDLG